MAPPSVPCWLCGKTIAVRRTKEGRPFLVCMDCGLQMFIRSSAGEERLMARCAEHASGAVQEKGRAP